jgi:hypothetical protein
MVTDRGVLRLQAPRLIPLAERPFGRAFSLNAQCCCAGCRGRHRLAVGLDSRRPLSTQGGHCSHVPTACVCLQTEVSCGSATLAPSVPTVPPGLELGDLCVLCFLRLEAVHLLHIHMAELRASDHRLQDKARKQADKEARAVRKAAAGKSNSTLDSFINRVKYKVPCAR